MVASKGNPFMINQMSAKEQYCKLANRVEIKAVRNAAAIKTQKKKQCP
jgi:hypothetical protein